MYFSPRSLARILFLTITANICFAAGPESGLHPASPAAKSSSATSSDAAPSVNINLAVDALSNRHTISPYIYGGAYPQDAPTITDSGLSVVRWGGNSTSRYNWQLFTYNAANDYYFEDFNYSEIGDADSTKFITDVKNAGSHPLMTMAMLPWVAKTAENGTNGHWSFSVAKYGSQCSVDPYNTDAGDGLKTDCAPRSPRIQMTPTFRCLISQDRKILREVFIAISGRGRWRRLLARLRISIIWITRSTYGEVRTATCTLRRLPTMRCATRLSPRLAT